MKSKLAHVIGLTPFVWLVPALSAIDPIEPLTNVTGQASVLMALLSLAVTPLVKKGKLPKVFAYRRPLGLYAAFYAFLHLLVFFLSQGFFWPEILVGLMKPVNLIGLAVILIWIPLTITSTKGMMRRLRGNWGRLHMSVYPAGVLAVTHWFLAVKEIPIEAWIAAITLAVLLILRREKW